jgi:hypothetical protein
VDLFVEGRRQLRPPLLVEPIVEAVAHDSQEPGTAVAAAEPAKELERAQAGLLDHVLRVGVVARQPARQIVSGVHMRHDALLEACEFVLFVHGGVLRISGPLTIQTGVAAVLFPPPSLPLFGE